MQNFGSKNPKGKIKLEIPTRKWEDNIKMDPKEIGREGVGWIHLAQDRGRWRALVNTIMKLRIQ
jgi:hypothetical protein